MAPEDVALAWGEGSGGFFHGICKGGWCKYLTALSPDGRSVSAKLLLNYINMMMLIVLENHIRAFFAVIYLP